MYKHYLGPYYTPPGVEGATGTTENSVSGATATGGVTHGTASDALIKAAMDSSSESDSARGEADAAARPEAPGDTAQPDGQAAVAKPDATGQPGATGTKDAPQTRIEAAVKNARETAVRETEAKYAWAKGIDEGAVRTSFALANRILTDPTAFCVKLAQELGGRFVRGDEKPETTKEAVITRLEDLKLPKGRLHAEDGTEAYAADQIIGIVTSVAQALRHEFGSQLKPLTDARTTAAQAERVAAIRQEITASVGEALTEARKLKHFQVPGADGKLVDNPEILAILQAIPKATKLKVGAIGALHMAYNQYISTKVFPTVDGNAEQRVRDENKRKAAASVQGRPGADSGEGKKVEIKGISGLAAQMEKLAAQASV